MSSLEVFYGQKSIRLNLLNINTSFKNQMGENYVLKKQKTNIQDINKQGNIQNNGIGSSGPLTQDREL